MWILSLVLASIVHAQPAPRNCLVVLIGGGIEYRNDPANIDAAQKWLEQVRTQAQKTGCRIAEQSNQSRDEFLNFVRSLSSQTDSQTKVHFSLMDHGAPQPLDKPLNGQLVTGMGKRVKIGEFFDAISETFPRQHLSFDSSICYANLNGALLEYNRTKNLQMCGASSISELDKSNNQVERSEEDGNIYGIYSGLSMEVMAQQIEMGLTPTTVDTHLQARRADRANSSRRQGTLTSIEYARSILKKRGEEDLLAIAPLEYLAREQGVPREVWESFARPSEETPYLENWSEYWSETHFKNSCQPFKDQTGFLGSLLNSFDPHLFTLKHLVKEPTEVPSLNWRVRAAKRSLQNDLPMIRKEMIKANLMRKNFLERYAQNPEDLKLNAEVRRRWSNLNAAITRTLAPYAADMRILQEAKVRQDFLEVASPEERRVFERYQACELKGAI